MSGKPLTTAERFARHQRDLAAYQRRSLARRSHARFRRDLAVVPHVFLLPGRTSMTPLLASREEVLSVLSGRAVWTLDTAARLVGVPGFLVAADLTGYLGAEDLREIAQRGLVGAPQAGGISVDPLYRRPPMLLAHRPDESVPSVVLAGGDLVVPWEFLIRDVMGSLGWRPDLLTRLEATYPAALPT